MERRKIVVKKETKVKKWHESKTEILETGVICTTKSNIWTESSTVQTELTTDRVTMGRNAADGESYTGSINMGIRDRETPIGSASLGNSNRSTNIIPDSTSNTNEPIIERIENNDVFEVPEVISNGLESNQNCENSSEVDKYENPAVDENFFEIDKYENPAIDENMYEIDKYENTAVDENSANLSKKLCSDPPKNFKATTIDKCLESNMENELDRINEMHAMSTEEEKYMTSKLSNATEANSFSCLVNDVDIHDISSLCDLSTKPSVHDVERTKILPNFWSKKVNSDGLKKCLEKNILNTLDNDEKQFYSLPLKDKEKIQRNDDDTDRKASVSHLVNYFENYKISTPKGKMSPLSDIKNRRYEFKDCRKRKLSSEANSPNRSFLKQDTLESCLPYEGSNQLEYPRKKSVSQNISIWENQNKDLEFRNIKPLNLNKGSGDFCVVKYNQPRTSTGHWKSNPRQLKERRFMNDPKQFNHNFNASKHTKPNCMQNSTRTIFFHPNFSDTNLLKLTDKNNDGKLVAHDGKSLKNYNCPKTVENDTELFKMDFTGNTIEEKNNCENNYVTLTNEDQKSKICTRNRTSIGNKDDKNDTSFVKSFCYLSLFMVIFAFGSYYQFFK